MSIKIFRKKFSVNFFYSSLHFLHYILHVFLHFLLITTNLEIYQKDYQEVCLRRCEMISGIWTVVWVLLESENQS